MAVSKGLKIFKVQTAWLFRRIYQNSKSKLVKGLFCLTPFPGMQLSEESSPIGSASPRAVPFHSAPWKLGFWATGREEYTKSFGHQGSCHPGIKSPPLFLLPKRTSCTHTFTRCPLLTPLAGLRISHKPSGSVLLALWPEFFAALIFVN